MTRLLINCPEVIVTNANSSQLCFALGSIFIECNSFVEGLVDLSWFERNELHLGEEVLLSRDGMLGGMVHVLNDLRIDPWPLISASSVSGPPVSSDCYQYLKSELVRRLVLGKKVDGILLALHGSGLVDGIGDLEGDLLAAIRAEVGPDTPIACGLDLHAHVTAQMLQNSDLLVAFETYPHTDAFRTGVRVARLLHAMTQGRIHPAMAMAKVPVLVSGVNGETEGPGPFADMMRMTKEYETSRSALSTSVFLVHPYLDLPGMGGGALVITENEPAVARNISTHLALEYWNRRFQLEPKVYRAQEAIRQAMAIDDGPIILSETSDCCGGGAAGDSVHALRALLNARVEDLCLATVVDAEAAALCHKSGAGNSVKLTLGHKHDPKWGKPIKVNGTVLQLSAGAFTYTGGFWKGQAATMGLSALVQVGSTQILIASKPTYEWADEQFRALQVDPRQAKLIVVKNPINYRLGYDYAKAAFILDTPGPTPATLMHTDYKNLRRPYYPADRHIAGLQPEVISK